MQAHNIVLLQCDRGIAQSLVSALSHTFRSVHQVESLSDLRTSISKHRAQVAILDMEKASLTDVWHLAHEFPGSSIVCTHRCADEEMWAAALNAGARDVYSAADVPGIVRAALASCENARSVAA
jgi:DNA-binding NtrC family response regulator